MRGLLEGEDEQEHDLDDRIGSIEQRLKHLNHRSSTGMTDVLEGLRNTLSVQKESKQSSNSRRVNPKGNQRSKGYNEPDERDDVQVRLNKHRNVVEEERSLENLVDTQNSTLKLALMRTIGD